MIQMICKHLKPLFLVLSYPRTGSTLLTSALNHHPDISVAGELLNPKNRKISERYQEVFFKDRFMSSCYEQSDLLASSVYRFFESFNGFKIVYDQISFDSPVVELLQNVQDLKIIFMSRNFLSSAISYWFAITTNKWQCKQGEEVYDKPCYVDPDFVRLFIDEASRNSSHYKSVFKENDVMDVNYDCLVEKWDEVVLEIQNFLGISVCGLNKTLSKRLLLPFEQLAINYEELKRVPIF
jgi:LPS sulfotransferase NodH